MSVVRTRYTVGREPGLAYQVVGAGGGVDVVSVSPPITNVELRWELPTIARAMTRLAGLGRYIHYDRRGAGLSDPSPGPYTLADEADDLLAVMDAAGVERAAITGYLAGGPVACLFAARYPERVGWLILDTCPVRQTYAEDYAWAPTREERAALASGLREIWGDGALLAAFAPAWARDPAVREWMGRMERMGTSPSTFQRVMKYMDDTDVRGVLPSIRAPTLVVRRRDDAQMDRRHSTYLAQSITGARLEELAGSDSFPWTSDPDAWIDLVGRFVTGSPPPVPATRALATLLFTDIVDSTATLGRLGDEAWRRVLEQHDAEARAAVLQVGGRVVKFLGDGVFARFDAVPDAVAAGCALASAVKPLGIEIRAGVHLGDCEIVGIDLAGRTVHEAARISALAGPGECLISDAAHGLIAGAGIAATDHGLHTLKGFAQPYRLWAVKADGRARL